MGYFSDLLGPPPRCGLRKPLAGGRTQVAARCAAHHDRRSQSAVRDAWGARFLTADGRPAENRRMQTTPHHPLPSLPITHAAPPVPQEHFGMNPQLRNACRTTDAIGEKIAATATRLAGAEARHRLGCPAIARRCPLSRSSKTAKRTAPPATRSQPAQKAVRHACACPLQSRLPISADGAARRPAGPSRQLEAAPWPARVSVRSLCRFGSYRCPRTLRLTSC